MNKNGITTINNANTDKAAITWMERGEKAEIFKILKVILPAQLVECAENTIPHNADTIGKQLIFYEET